MNKPKIKCKSEIKHLKTQQGTAREVLLKQEIVALKRVVKIRTDEITRLNVELLEVKEKNEIT